eukprot:970769-Pyramimonas_sp.AAC.1
MDADTDWRTYVDAVSRGRWCHVSRGFGCKDTGGTMRVFKLTETPCGCHDAWTASGRLRRIWMKAELRCCNG